MIIKIVNLPNKFVKMILPTKGRLIELYVKYLSRSPYLFQDVSGLIFEFQPGDRFSYWLDRNLCNDDPGLIHYMRRVLAPNDLIFDIGAHWGSTVLTAVSAMNWSGKVFAFEPATSNYKRLLRNIQLNQAEEICSAFQMAITDSSGQVTLNLFSNRGSGWHTLGWFEFNGVKPESSEKIPSTSLDEFCQQRGITNINFLKMDVEGAEPKVLAGAKHLLKNHAINRVIFELSITPLQGLNYSVEDVIQPLLSNDFRIKRIALDGTLDDDGSYRDLKKLCEMRVANYVAIAPGITDE